MFFTDKAKELGFTGYYLTVKDLIEQAMQSQEAKKLVFCYNLILTNEERGIERNQYTEDLKMILYLEAKTGI
jgi:hypothetical protein